MEKNNISMTAKALCNKMAQGKIDFDCSVQRGKVWDIEKKSLLIHSMMYGYSVPPFYFLKTGTGEYDALDGKQRSNAVYEFMNDEFMLMDKFPPVYDDNGNVYDYSGKKYSELDEWAQDVIKDFNFTIYGYDSMTEEEVREFFRRLNNGKPLTAVELTRVKAKSIADFQDIGKCEAIQMAVTDKGRARFADENIAMQTYAMFHMENPDFGTRAFRPYIQEVVVSEEEKAEIKSALDRVRRLMEYLMGNTEDEENGATYKKVFKKIKSRTHLVSVAYLAGLMANNSQEEFNDAVIDFFDATKTSKSEMYNSTVGAGSAKAEAVQARKAAIDTLYRQVA